ncbi:MAG: hypothetical protein CMA97_05830 [Euryarchaeota archaeon]|nr:hypothetical protein [Euryarchaeota archaeon]
MFSTVDMSRLTLAAPVDSMHDVMRACSDLGCVHIEDYTHFEEGIGVGQAIQNQDADLVSSLLLKVRAVRSAISVYNSKGSVSSKVAKSLVEKMSSELDNALQLIEEIRESEAEIATLDDQLRIFERLAPLEISLDLLSGYQGVEIYVAETQNSSKAHKVFADMASRIEYLCPNGLVAVACAPEDAASVQIALAELNAKAIQIPAVKGTPKERAMEAKKSIAESQSVKDSNQQKLDKWAKENGSNLVVVEEYLQREDAIYTSPTSLAVSNQAFALDAWIPTENTGKARSKLKNLASHLEIEEHVDDHHHDGHDDEHHGLEPPVEYDTIDATRHASMLTNLVGRPKYGTIDPTSMIAFTFPIFYGLILGDAGYGICIILLALLLKAKLGHDPMGAIASRILMNMGIATLIVGILCAEAFGFVIEDWSPFAAFYDMLYNSTHNLLEGTVFAELFGLTHTYLPFHRAGGALQDYILLSIYLGCAHLLLGFIIGFINVMKAHGPVAAFFEKGSWLLILIGGSAHILRFITDDSYGTFEGSIWSGMVIAGVICLIYGLAVYEGFGWLGGIIMGPIETFGLLANTLSYLRVMAVGVAGVKIAEVGNNMGFANMADAISSGDILVAILCLLIWLGVQIFALALGLLSPSIHAIRLHFVEWMGKFYDGSGRAFAPLGGQPLHVEGNA